MPSVSYRYTKPYLVLGTGFDYGPYLEVVLQHGGSSARVPGLIDSGAHDCLFHVDFAERLGLVIASGTPGQIGGVGGIADAWYFDIMLKVPRASPFLAKVGFSDGVSTSYGILGRHCFFARFTVGIDEPNRRWFYHPVT